MIEIAPGDGALKHSSSDLAFQARVDQRECSVAVVTVHFGMVRQQPLGTVEVP